MPVKTLRFLFYLGHPAHYHNLKYSIASLINQGHAVKVVARGKDVLFELLASEPWDIYYLPSRKAKGKLALVGSILAREWKMIRLVRKFKPHLLAGTDLVITHVGRLFGIPAIIINEDDSAAIPLMAKYGFPFATAILAPDCCDQSPANHKKIGYKSYHELAYLHPDNFQKNSAELPEILATGEPYALLRFASLHAHHDKGRTGIDDELALELIGKIESKYRVFITSERPLSANLERYRLPVHPRDIHQVMAHAKLYIGDSQTMAAEAAVLGVPSIRFNDFVGELSYLEELENLYGLTKGIRTDRRQVLFDTLDEWLNTTDLQEVWQARRRFMLDECISVSPFWVATFLQFAAPIR